MAGKGRSLALALFVLMPLGVLTGEERSPQSGREPEPAPLLSAPMPRSPRQPARDAAYGFGTANPQATRYASLAGFLDAALGEADDEPAVEQDEPVVVQDVPVVEQDGPIISADTSFFTVGATMHPRRETAARLGFWIVGAEGDPAKVGEYQGLDSSVFWDVDRLASDGTQSIDLIATGLDNESTLVDLTLIDPVLSLDFDFQRYLHRFEHVPLTNMPAGVPVDQIVGQDLNAGKDYAVRVQEVKCAIKGSLSANTKARININVLRKFGARQANTMQHCADSALGISTSCHVLSQRQRIDWLTVKIEPIVETRIGPFRAEYSRPMRFFSQHDQLLTANYGDFHLYDLGEEVYAVVPDSISQADRLKLGVDLGPATTFYVNSQIRDTKNRFRDTHRQSYGFDMRLTNRSCDGLTLTAHATVNNQTNQNVPFFLHTEEVALGIPTARVPPYGIRHPIDYFRSTLGADASWYPFRCGTILRGLSVAAGAEFGRIDRSFASYVVQDLDNPPGPVIDQEATDYVAGRFDTSLRWSPCLETFVRCKIRATDNPLFGVNKHTGYTTTSLPGDQQVVEVGGTWMPTDNLLATATVGIENRNNDSDLAFFDEDDYPMTYTIWYAPTPKWSLSAGYGYYSNWIDQDISFPSDDPMVQTGDIRRLNYGGRGQVLSLGSDYAWSERLLLLGEVEFVHSQDAFDPFEPWPDLPFYSDVIVDRTRVTAGIDWLATDKISTYFRYVFEDYEDKSVDYNSGTAHMFLAGLSTIY